MPFKLEVQSCIQEMINLITHLEKAECFLLLEQNHFSLRRNHTKTYGVHVSDGRSQVDVLALTLEEYKRQHEVYPEQLDALVPALLPAIPKPRLMGFKYNRKADTNSYSLYYKSSLNRTCYYTPEIKFKCNAD